MTNERQNSLRQNFNLEEKIFSFHFVQGKILSLMMEWHHLGKILPPNGTGLNAVVDCLLNNLNAVKRSKLNLNFLITLFHQIKGSKG